MEGHVTKIAILESTRFQSDHSPPSGSAQRGRNECEHATVYIQPGCSGGGGATPPPHPPAVGCGGACAGRPAPPPPHQPCITCFRRHPFSLAHSSAHSLCPSPPSCTNLSIWCCCCLVRCDGDSRRGSRTNRTFVFMLVVRWPNEGSILKGCRHPLKCNPPPSDRSSHYSKRETIAPLTTRKCTLVRSPNPERQ
jgi:hypothetical protein